MSLENLLTNMIFHLHLYRRLKKLNESKGHQLLSTNLRIEEILALVAYNQHLDDYSTL